MVSRPARQINGGQALQSATKTADKNNGGQALDLLTIALKTDSDRSRDSVKQKIYGPTQKLFCMSINRAFFPPF